MVETGIAAGVGDLDLDSLFAVGGKSSGGGGVQVDDTAFKCENPHWRVSRDDFKKVLSILGTFPVRSDVYMAVWRVGSSLMVHANNRDAVLDCSLALLNDDGYDSGDRVYFLNSGKLSAFVNAYDSFVFSFDAEGDIYYESKFSSYRLDVIKVSFEDFRVKLDEVSWWSVFPLGRDNIVTLRALYGFAPRVSDSKVLLDNGKAEAFFSLYRYDIQCPSSVEEKVVVRRLDLGTIQELFGGSPLMFAVTANRLYFKFGLGVVSFIRVPYCKDDFGYPATFAVGNVVGNFQVDCGLLKRAFRLVDLIGVDVVEFRSNDNGDISLAASDRAVFNVGYGSLASVFTVSADLLGRVVGTIGGDVEAVGVVVTARGVELTPVGGSVVYSMSNVSPSQYKRGEVKLSVGGEPGLTVTSGVSKVRSDAPEYQKIEIF
jgi:hypothetical protein